MKKSLIALAALATVGAAQAQSSVTVYGTYDVGYQGLSYDNVGGSTTTFNQRKSSGLSGSALTSNRIGFRGTEDLGGGLSARFNLEYGFANNIVGDTVTTTVTTVPPSTSSQTLATAGAQPGVISATTGSAIQTRTSRVGLASNKYGSLDLGYGLTGLFNTVTGHSPLPGNNWVGDLAYTDNSISSADSRILLGAVRANGVQYNSPTINGLRATVDWGAGSYKFGDNSADDTRVSNAGITLNYKIGALDLAATTHKLKSDASFNTYTTAANLAAGTVGTAGNNNINTVDFQALSARYAITSTLSVNALYAKNKTTGQANTQTGKNDVTQVGVKYDMGKTSLVAQYGEGEGEAAPGADRRDRKAYQLGAIYNLSKRTNVYAIYGSQEARYVTTTNVGNVEKVSGLAAGLRHAF